MVMTSVAMMRRAAAALAAHNASSRSVTILHRSAVQPRVNAAPTAAAWRERWQTQTRAFSAEEKVTFTFIDAEGETATVAATPGQSLLDVAHENDIELEGALNVRVHACVLRCVCCLCINCGVARMESV